MKHHETKPDVVTRFGNTIQVEGDRLTRLLNAFLDLTKIEAGCVDWHDSDVVAASLVALAARRGQRVVGLKPVAAGADATPGGLRNADALALAAAGSVPLPYTLTNPYCFEPAIAPHLAAAEAGAAVPVDDLVEWYGHATSGAELAIVEGAGGWRVPLHPEGFLSDLPERLGLGVILVVGLRLGCLNHARLTAEAIAGGGLARIASSTAKVTSPSINSFRGAVKNRPTITTGAFSRHPIGIRFRC